MNDHLAKPVNPDTLQRVVELWARRGSDGRHASSGATVAGAAAVEKPLGGLAAHLSGAALLPVIDEFSEGAAARMIEVERAVSAGDLALARGIAHDLSGSAANLGFIGLSRLARSIEIACTESDAGTATRLVTALPGVLRQVLAELATKRAQAAAPATSQSGTARDDARPGGP